MRIAVRTAAAFFTLICAASLLYSQVATGSYPYGTFDALGPDTINVGNLNVHLSIPILNKAGRGLPFTYVLTFDNSIWYPYEGTWTPVQNWGWKGQTEITTGYVSFNSSTSNGRIRGSGGLWYTCPTTTNSNFVYHDTFGVSHAFVGSTLNETQWPQECGSQNNTPNFNATATDGSGYTLAVSAYSRAALSTANGRQISPPTQTGSGAAGVIDSNGNEISVDGSGHFTDTTGKVALTVAGSPTTSESFTYTDASGNPQKVVVNYLPFTIQTAFGCSGITEYPETQGYLVSSIELADTSTYTFQYERISNGNYTGRLSTVTLPQGGIITYSYLGSNGGVNCADGSTNTLKRQISATAGSAPSTWTYTRTQPNGSGTSHTEAVDGLSNYKEYDFVLPASSSQYAVTPSTYYETGRQIYQGAKGGTPIFARSTCYNAKTPSCLTTQMSLPITQIDTYDTYNGIQMDGSTTKFNAYGATTESDIYDFGGSSSRGTLLRQEQWSYTGSFPNIPTNDAVFDANRKQAAHIAYNYDQTTPTPSSGVPQHLSVTCPCGNLTSENLYYGSSNYYTITNTYEDTGSVLTSTTPNGKTTLGYDSTFVYNTSTNLPTPSSGVSLSVGGSYDRSYTGLPLTSTDMNGQVSQIVSYDEMLRPTEATYPDGGKTTLEYSPTSTTANIYQSLSVHSTSESQLDEYARQSRTLLSNGQSKNPWYQQDICYDANGNVSFGSYRYAGTGASGNNCTTGGDTYAYDVLGRILSVKHADGTMQTFFYNGRATQFTDEYGVTRITQADGLGRPTIVCEISSNSGMPGSGSPTSCGTDITGTGFTTNYSYALATGTTTVTQGAQTRKFQVDWLGRPTYISEPESGTTTYSYAYNSTGLLVTRTRPKANQTNPSVTTNTYNQYDSIGRPASISYNDGTTATKTFTYDFNVGWGSPQMNLKGRLSRASVNFAQTIFSYDPVGRVLSLGECTPSNCGRTNFATAYTYDLAGNRLTVMDSISATETYAYSLANEVLSITSSVTGDSPDLLSSVQNGPFGPTSWTLGNGLTGSRSYDPMGRVTGGSVVCNGPPNCTSAGTRYSFSSGWKGTYVTSSSDSVEGQHTSYFYDSFGRLSSTTATSASFNYVYDRWGNRWKESRTSGSGPNQTLTFTNTNHVYGSGYTYDAAGNMTSDGVNSYTYDAEGNVTQVDGGAPNGGSTYTYDALNHRVRVDGGGSEEFIYNPEGQHTSSWDVVNGWVWTGWFFWGSEQLGYYGCRAVYYQLHDWTGTERMQTDYAGNPFATFTSLPFGDGYSPGYLPCPEGPAAHFATLDHDSSSNEHAQFREYSNMAGRWFSPDPYSGSYDPTNPQSFNRYAYVLNSPLSFIDPLGFCVTPGVIFCINGWAPYPPPDGGVGAGGFPGGPSDGSVGIPLIYRGGQHGSGGAPNNNNPFKEWPLNGNITPATYQQDQKCSAGPVIGPAMDSLPGVLAACQWHDNKYLEYNCNATSWISPFPGPCKAINYMLLIKIYNALPIEPF